MPSNIIDIRVSESGWEKLGLILNLGSKAMIKRRFASFVFRHIPPRYNGNIHDPPPAGFTFKWRLLGAMPYPAVMDCEITGFYIKSYLSGIRCVIDEIFFPEQQTQDALLVRSR